MGKLAETTRSTRKYLIYFLIFAFVIIILQAIYGYLTSREDTGGNKASPYAYIDNKLGEIEYPTIPTLTLSEGSTPVFSIDGRFTESPSSVNVYQVEPPRETLASVSDGQSIADSLEFNPNYSTSDNSLIWQSANKSRKLEYDKITRDVYYINSRLDKTDYSEEYEETIKTEKLNTTFSNIYRDLSASNYTQLIDEITYISEANSSYEVVPSMIESDLIRKDSFMELEEVSLKTNLDIEGVIPIRGKIYLDNPYTGITNTTILKRDTTSKVKPTDILKEFNERGIKISGTKGVYTLKNIEEAWEDVRDGKASLRSLLKPDQDQFTNYSPLNVTRFIVDPEESHLGYYLTPEWKGFLYPIYVFKGTAELKGGGAAEFIFYTKAIDN